MIIKIIMEKKFTCYKCDMKFVSSSKLERHLFDRKKPCIKKVIEIITTIPDFEPSQKIRHIVYNQKEPKCQYCDKLFTSRSSLYRHVNKYCNNIPKKDIKQIRTKQAKREAKAFQLAVPDAKLPIEVSQQPIQQIFNIQQNIHIDYKNIIVNDNGNFLIGDIEIKTDEISMLDPTKMDKKGVLQSIYQKFPMLHYPRGMEDFSHITDDIKIPLFNKPFDLAMKELFNYIYQCPRNNNIGIDIDKSIIYSIKKDKIMNELVVALGIIDEQIASVADSFLYMFMQQLKTVKGKISDLKYKEHESIIENLVDAEESKDIQELYRSYLFSNSKKMVDIFKMHENIFQNLKKLNTEKYILYEGSSKMK